MGGDTKMLCQNLTVTRSLIEHVDEIGVFKDVLNLPAAEKVFDVLGDAGGDSGPFSEPLPDFYGLSCSLFLL